MTTKRNKRPLVVNDIRECVAQAQLLVRLQHRGCRSDRKLRRVFAKLAGDETTGLLAYAIWRSRSQLLSSLSAR